MSSSERFCLRWNDFEVNISNAFHHFKEEKDFADVTLACGDNQVEAHKVILATSSPFFKRILQKHPHSHPLIYLKGIKSSDVESVLNYIYHGEVNIEQANLESFLEVAENLEVKGLNSGRDHGGGSNMQSSFLKNNMQSSNSRITKQSSVSRANAQSTVHTYGQLPLQTTMRGSTPSVNNNTSEVVPVKVESEETFSALALEETQQGNGLSSFDHHQEHAVFSILLKHFQILMNIREKKLNHL